MVAVADPVVRIEPTRVVVEPGGQVQVRVSVRNPGQLVEGYRLTVHGPAAEWAEVTPAEDAGADERDVVRVYPGQENGATVVFTGPPAASGRAGEVPFCVLAQSVVDPTSSAAAEGDLEVGRVDGLAASLTPLTSTGRWSGRHAVRLDNWGNGPAVLRLTASDPDDNLAFLVHPPRVQLPVGGHATVAVRVRARHPFLRGTKVRRAFRVVAEPEAGQAARPPGPEFSDPRRPVLDGALDQKPVLTRLSVAAGAIAVLALAAGVAMAVTADPVPAAVARLDTDVAPPEGLTVTALDPAAVELAWAGFGREPDAVKVFRIDPDSVEQDPPVAVGDPVDVDGSAGKFVLEDLEPDKEVCVQVATVRGDRISPRSEAVCERTPPAAAAEPSPSESTPPEAATPAPPGGGGAGEETTPADSGASTPPGGSAAPTEGGPTAGGSAPPEGAAAAQDFGDDWVIGIPLPAGPTTEARASARETEFRAVLEDEGREDLQAGRIDSTRYPRLGFTRPSVYVYVSAFGSADDARALCEPLGLQPSQCHPRQPGAPAS